MSLDARNWQSGEPCFDTQWQITVVWLDEVDLVEYGPRVAREFFQHDFELFMQRTARYRRGWWGNKDGPAE